MGNLIDFLARLAEPSAKAYIERLKLSHPYYFETTCESSIYETAKAANQVKTGESRNGLKKLEAQTNS